MRYLYTKEPDEGCHEIAPGIYGRPVRRDHEKRMMAKGWRLSVAELDEQDPALLYEAKFGKKPHHKMKPESILRALENDQAGIGEQNTDPAGDQHPDQ